MNIIRIISKDGECVDVVDEDGGAVFPYQEIAQLARDYGFTEYQIKIGVDAK